MIDHDKSCGVGLWISANTNIHPIPGDTMISSTSTRVASILKRVRSTSIGGEDHATSKIHYMTAGKISPLVSLLLWDLESSSPSLIVPYLTTTDFLKLSECSPSLRAFRHCITAIKLVWHPWAILWLTSRLRKRLVRLMLDLRGSLHYVRCHEHRLIAVLGDVIAAGESLRGKLASITIHRLIIMNSNQIGINRMLHSLN